MQLGPAAPHLPLAIQGPSYGLIVSGVGSPFMGAGLGARAQKSLQPKAMRLQV